MRRRRDENDELSAYQAHKKQVKHNTCHMKTMGALHARTNHPFMNIDDVLKPHPNPAQFADHGPQMDTSDPGIADDDPERESQIEAIRSEREADYYNALHLQNVHERLGSQVGPSLFEWIANGCERGGIRVSGEEIRERFEKAANAARHYDTSTVVKGVAAWLQPLQIPTNKLDRKGDVSCQKLLVPLSCHLPDDAEETQSILNKFFNTSDLTPDEVDSGDFDLSQAWPRFLLGSLDDGEPDVEGGTFLRNRLIRAARRRRYLQEGGERGAHGCCGGGPLMLAYIICLIRHALTGDDKLVAESPCFNYGEWYDWMVRGFMSSTVERQVEAICRWYTREVFGATVTGPSQARARADAPKRAEPLDRARPPLQPSAIDTKPA